MSFFAMPPLPTFSDIGSLLGGASGGKIKLESVDASVSDKITFNYNPTSFGLDRTVTWDDKKTPKETTGVLNFTGGASDTINFVVLLDATEEDGDKPADLLTKVKTLYAFTKATVSDGNGDTATHKRPPVLKLTWKDIQFVGVISALKFDFVMFNPEGQPVRANVTITMLGRAFRTDTADAFFDFYSMSK